jgi:hypothetical protein
MTRTALGSLEFDDVARSSLYLTGGRRRPDTIQRSRFQTHSILFHLVAERVSAGWQLQRLPLLEFIVAYPWISSEIDSVGLKRSNNHARIA